MHNMKENIDMDLFWRGKVCSCHGRQEKDSFKSCFSSNLISTFPQLYKKLYILLTRLNCKEIIVPLDT